MINIFKYLKASYIRPLFGIHLCKYIRKQRCSEHEKISNTNREAEKRLGGKTTQQIKYKQFYVRYMFVNLLSSSPQPPPPSSPPPVPHPTRSYPTKLRVQSGNRGKNENIKMPLSVRECDTCLRLSVTLQLI